MRPIVTDRVAWSVGLSVCLSVTLVNPPKTSAPIEMLFELRTRVVPTNHVLDKGADPPMGRANFEGGKGLPIVKYAVIYAKTAEPIEMPFGLWAWMGRKNHVLDGGPAVLRDVAAATIFGTKIAINCLCVNNSD